MSNIKMVDASLCNCLTGTYAPMENEKVSIQEPKPIN